MSLVHNERTKLTATWVSSVAAAIVATGVIAPIVAVVFGIPTFAAITPGTFTLATLVWLVLGIAAHIWARYSLGRLRE
jgi:hypothetical protein